MFSNCQTMKESMFYPENMSSSTRKTTQPSYLLSVRRDVSMATTPDQNSDVTEGPEIVGEI